MPQSCMSSHSLRDSIAGMTACDCIIRNLDIWNRHNITDIAHVLLYSAQWCCSGRNFMDVDVLGQVDSQTLGEL